jgi:hypothetical protein
MGYRLSAAIVLFLVLVCGLQAQTLEGLGLADSQELARNIALQEIGAQIEVTIRSSSTGRQTAAKGAGVDTYHATAVVETQALIDLPLLGVKVENLSRTARGEYAARASMPVKPAMQLYLTQIGEINRSLAELWRLQSTQTGAEREASVNQAINQVGLYDKYRNILLGLGHETPPVLSVDRAQILAAAGQLAARIDTLDKAAQELCRGITQNQIFVYPFQHQGSTEVSPFGRTLRDLVQAQVSAVDNHADALHMIRGTYRGDESGIDVTLTLSPAQGADRGRLLATRVVRLLPEAYRGLDWSPKAPGLDQLIQDGFVVSSDFRLEATTNRGKEAVLFARGDVAEILVKANRPAYLYILSHIDVDGRKFSYLLDLDQGNQNNRRFIFYLGPDMVNKWVSLGSFNIVPPFGVERLQFMASSKDQIDAIPPYRYDTQSGYFLVGDSQAETVVRTRGLQKQKTTETLSAEAALTITTME